MNRSVRRAQKKQPLAAAPVLSGVDQRLARLRRQVSSVKVASDWWHSLSPQQKSDLVNEANAREMVALPPATHGPSDDADKNNLRLCMRQLQGGLGMYTSLHKVSREAAVVALAEWAQLLSAVEAQELRTSLAIPPAPTVRPEWNGKTGELRYNGVLVRSVSSRAKNIIKLLDAFEKAGWPTVIDNPLSIPKRDGDRARGQVAADTIQQLKSDSMKFSVREGGRRLSWQPTPS